MKYVTTIDLAEAAWYLQQGLTLEGLELRASKAEPGRMVVVLIFAGVRAGELGVECMTRGPYVLPGDLERLSKPLAHCLANALNGGKKGAA